MPITTLVVDDEPLARRGVRRLLAADPEIEVVGDCGSGAEAVQAIRALRPQLVFLDVQMPELDGFGVIQAVGPERMPAVIFVTAHDRFALRAFEVHAVDYLLKPFDDERFARALTRAKSLLRHDEMTRLSGRLVALLESSGHRAPSAPAAAAPTAAEPTVGAPPAAPHDASEAAPTRFLVRVGARMVPLPVDDVDWIEAADYYVRLHVRGRGYLHRESLASLAGRLDPARWMRIHRSAIVNLQRVRELAPLDRGDMAVVLVDGTRLRLGRSRRAALERALRGPGPA